MKNMPPTKARALLNHLKRGVKVVEVYRLADLSNSQRAILLRELQKRDAVVVRFESGLDYVLEKI